MKVQATKRASNETPRVLIVGGGFAGIHAAKQLKHARVHVTVVDRKNHHTFQPLLYQVATAVLSPAEIASPIRSVLRDNRDCEVLMGEVDHFDLPNRTAHLVDGKQLAYDYLILASGATHSYFGHDEWQPLAPGLKTLEDATDIRRRVLLAFELAEKQAFEKYAQPTPLNFVVIGAGPTGVELAGAIAGIARRYMVRDFRHIDPAQARVLLLEGGPRVLPTYADDLSASAKKQLEELGVEVHTGVKVTGIEPGIVIAGEERIPAAVTLWAAGVRASRLGKALGAPTDRSGRAIVDEQLNIADHPEVFVCGDLAAREESPGRSVPGLAPAAMQMGRFAAKCIEADLAGRERAKFHYVDKGTMATIGRNRAIAQIGKLHLSGFVAWLAWLFVHILFLIGFRNRAAVIADWAWTYLTVTSGARLITGETDLPGWGKAS